MSTFAVNDENFSHLSCGGYFRWFSQLGHLGLLHTALSDSNTFFYMVESWQQYIYYYLNNSKYLGMMQYKMCYAALICKEIDWRITQRIRGGVSFQNYPS